MASLQKVTLTIAQSATTSDEIGWNQLRNCRALSIIAPAVLTGTITAETADLAPDEIGGGSPTWVTIQSPPGTDVTCEAGKATVLTVTPFARFRLKSAIAEAGPRTFVLWLQIGE
jgi:hypothetical protein